MSTTEKQILVKFQTPSYRAGQLSGLFVTTRSALDSIIGKTVYFGEVLGKHSEVELDLVPTHFTVLAEDADTIDDIQARSGFRTTIIGYNPFDYVSEEEEEGEEGE